MTIKSFVGYIIIDFLQNPSKYSNKSSKWETYSILISFYVDMKLCLPLAAFLGQTTRG